jgi:dTDP-glucose 4,6-dehydratase
MIHRAVTGGELPIYGDGKNIRDWLYVTDHCSAIRTVLEKGALGETYNVGGLNEKTNLDVVYTLCDILDSQYPKADGSSYRTQIVYVKDRPGHDRRYAIDATKINNELGWKPAQTFETGIALTVRWYMENQNWIDNVTSGAYRDWVQKQYTV